MSDLDDQSERDPVFWWHGHPVRVATLLVIIHVACLLICAFLYATGHQAWLGFVAFSTFDFLHGYLYTPFTYGLVHLPAAAFSFAMEMFILWSFGGQVEEFFGRKVFLKLYALLWFVSPLVFLIFHLLGAQELLGSRNLHMGIFVAFAALYPSARVYFGIQAFWLAIIVVAAYSVIDISEARMASLIALWAAVATSWYFVAYARGEITIQLPAFLRPKPKFRVLPKPQPIRRVAPVAVRDSAMDDVDDLLDKIARTGLNSLTPEERARLERASADLKKNR